MQMSSLANSYPLKMIIPHNIRRNVGQDRRMQTLCEHLFSAKVVYQSRVMNALINMVLITNNREIKIHVYAKRKT